MTLTYLQQLWLNSRGGRNISDVIVIDGELFIAMRSGGKWVPTLIPNDRQIKRIYHIEYYTPKKTSYSLKHHKKSKSPLVLRYSKNH